MILMREAASGSLAWPEIFFDFKWISWFVKAVQDEGMPLSMWGGDASFGGGGEGSYTSWGDTMLDAILPFESLEGYNPPNAEFQRPQFVDPDHPLARLPWKDAGPVELLNKVEVKQGATLVAKAVAPGKDFPWIAWWRSDQGKVVCETQVFGSHGTTNKMLVDWRWYQDFLIYLTYFGADKPIPLDVYRAHRIREEINTHLAKSALLMSLLEFVEKFGGSTVKLYEELEDLNDLEKVAEEHYRIDDYDGAAEIFEDVHLAWNELNTKAIEVKQNALVWVYVIEWLTVSAAAMISGVFLWYVMISRRLYREMGTTRASELGD
jgi:uncharacterized membrane protein